MAYEVYLDDMLLPVTPSKIEIKVGGQNKTANLISGEEINITKAPGLKEISFTAMIPQADYPFAVYDGSFEDAESFLDRLADLKEGKGCFDFVIIREGPGGHDFFDTNIYVTLEDYKVTDDAKEGFDLSVAINLKEYRNYGTKIMNFVIVEDAPVPTSPEPEADRPGEAPPVKTYTVVKGDCLWNIAMKLLGNGSRYPEIYNLNRDKISNPNRIQVGWVLTIP